MNSNCSNCSSCNTLADDLCSIIVCSNCDNLCYDCYVLKRQSKESDWVEKLTSTQSLVELKLNEMNNNNVLDRSKMISLIRECTDALNLLNYFVMNE